MKARIIAVVVSDLAGIRVFYKSGAPLLLAATYTSAFGERLK